MSPFVGVAEHGRLQVCRGGIKSAWARSGGIKHGPDNLASVGRPEKPKGARETSHNAEPSPMNVKSGVPPTRQVPAAVSNGQAQGPEVPGDRQVDLGASMDRRVCNELADHQARARDERVQSQALQGTRHEVPRGVWRGRMRCQS